MKTDPEAIMIEISGLGDDAPAPAPVAKPAPTPAVRVAGERVSVEVEEEAPPIGPKPALPVGGFVRLHSTSSGNVIIDGHFGVICAVEKRPGVAPLYEVRWNHPGSPNPTSWETGAELRLLRSDVADKALDNAAHNGGRLARRPAKPAPDAPKPERPESWPVVTEVNREAWLTCAARDMAKRPQDLAGVVFSVGYGKGGTRGASDFAIVENDPESGEPDGRQVFIRPTVHAKNVAAAAVSAALSALGVAHREPPTASWPDYPQADVTEEHKPQTTRLLKCVCPACGFTMRTTLRWLNKASDGVSCPDDNCHTPMTCERP